MSAAEQPLARLRDQLRRELGTAVDPTPVVQLRALCRMGVEVLGADGVEIVLVDAAGVAGVLAGAGRPGRAVGEDLQLTLGEGPAVLAATTGRPVRVPRLDGDAVARWPGWAPLAAAGGTGAAFSYPLRVGAVRLGALDVHRRDPGDLDELLDREAHALAEIAVGVLLAGQRRAGPGRTPEDVDDALAHHTAVHQAQGMVSVQLGVDLPAALARLRARSFIEERSLVEVARDVVARRLRFEPDVPDDEPHQERRR